MFIKNSVDTVAVQRNEVQAMVVQELLIVFKMITGPDIVYEQAQDQAQLNTLKARTWGQLTEE